MPGVFRLLVGVAGLPLLLTGGEPTLPLWPLKTRAPCQLLRVRLPCVRPPVVVGLPTVPLHSLPPPLQPLLVEQPEVDVPNEVTRLHHLERPPVKHRERPR